MAGAIGRRSTLIDVIEVTSRTGKIQQPEWLQRAEAVHRQLRPHLISDYPAAMETVFAEGGRMLVATETLQVVGVAIYRIFTNTAYGRQLYVDDLVTDERRRSHGVGAALLSRLEAIARAANCEILSLDSGTPRHRAHGFYFREGMHISSFHFAKKLD